MTPRTSSSGAAATGTGAFPEGDLVGADPSVTHAHARKKLIEAFRGVKADQTYTMPFGPVPGAMLRSPGVFGPEAEVADDAPIRDKLIAFTGRTP